MKKTLSTFAFLTLLTLSHAYATTANIEHIVCQGSQPGVGAVSVAFTRYKTFNITEFSAFGFPFTQQAVLLTANSYKAELAFELRGLTTGLIYNLSLYPGTKRGLISTIHGTMQLKCSAKISR